MLHRNIEFSTPFCLTLEPTAQVKNAKKNALLSVLIMSLEAPPAVTVAVTDILRPNPTRVSDLRDSHQRFENPVWARGTHAAKHPFDETWAAEPGAYALRQAPAQGAIISFTSASVTGFL
jgi:hypothetical protein